MRHAFPPLVFNSKSIPPPYKLAPWTLRLTTNTDVTPLVQTQNLGSSHGDRARRKPREPLVHRQPGRGLGGGSMEQVGFSSSIPNPGGRRRAGKTNKKNPNQQTKPTQFSTAGRTAAWGTRRCPPGPPAPSAGGSAGGTGVFSKHGKYLHLFLFSSTRGGCLYTRLALLQGQRAHP